MASSRVASHGMPMKVWIVGSSVMPGRAAISRQTIISAISFLICTASLRSAYSSALRSSSPDFGLK